MIIRSERDIADHVAAGRLGPEDAAAVHTFAAFLREKAAADRASYDGDADAPRAWWARWRGYALGETDGPTPEQAAGCPVSPDDPQTGADPQGGAMGG